MPTTETLNRYGQRPYPFAERCALGPSGECTKSATFTCPDCDGRFCQRHQAEHDCPGDSEVTVDEAVQRG